MISLEQPFGAALLLSVAGKPILPHASLGCATPIGSAGHAGATATMKAGQLPIHCPLNSGRKVTITSVKRESGLSVVEFSTRMSDFVSIKAAVNSLARF
jgi:hypothetical protein